MLAINHLSMLDPIIVGALIPRPIHFMAKRELFEYPLLGWLLPRVYAFPVRRGQADREALTHALAVLRSGGMVGIFPEGTRSDRARLLELQGGTAFLALKSGAPVVPIAIVGTELAMPRGARWPRRVKVSVRVGEPLPVRQAAWGGQLKERVQNLSGHIAVELGRLMDQLLSG